MNANLVVASREPRLEVRLEPVVEERSHTGVRTTVFDVTDLSVYYGGFRAVRGATLAVYGHNITAIIGPSGCGKTTVLRCFNRMNDLVETARVEGKVLYHGIDLYAK